MSRIARAVIPGCVHHITQRGNNRQAVFFTADDYAAYLAILRDQARRYGLAVFGWCLMPNHVHLIATPQSDESLAKAVGRTHWLYARAVNRLHGRSGHLWQNRFYSCPLDEGHLWQALAYIERNPVRAKMVRRAWRHRWSSAAAHCGAKDATGLLDLASWRTLRDSETWREVLTRPQDAEMVEAIRTLTQRGRPLGSDRFISKVEAHLGRRLRALPVGRPRKKAGNR